MAKTVESICEAFIKDLTKVRNAARVQQSIHERELKDLYERQDIARGKGSQCVEICKQADTAINNIKELFGVKE